jgi:hypothetical protein
MKKVSMDSIQWSARKQLADLGTQMRKNGVLRARKLLKNRHHTFSSVKIRLPDILSLGGKERRSLTIAAVRKMKSHVYDKSISKVIIDFSKVTELHPCGMLLFLSEVERILESATHAVKLSATYPKNSVVEQMLQHIGLLQRLGLDARIEVIVAANVVPWLHASGCEGDLGSIADVLPKVLTESSNMKLRIALLTGMAEAVANSSEHAYRKTHTRLTSGDKKKWWLFARQVDEDIAVAICDLGLGIPGTLEANWRDELAAVLKTRSGLKRRDHKMIELAFTVGKTSTDKKNRGKGLKDILKVVHEQEVGSIFIYSNKGVYIKDNVDNTYVSRDEKVSINGTIIMWKIPIEAFEIEGA